MAKAFLYTIVGLLVAILAGAILLNFFWREAMEMVSVPRSSFSDEAPPRAPDYNSLGAWFAKPAPADPKSRGAAVFFITPTGYFRSSHWNGPVDAPETDEFYDYIALPFAAEAFGALPLYAPRYRQATYGAFFALDKGGREALDLAYSDVSRAFNHFLDEIGDRPFILAGHEQGSLHGLRLAQEIIAGTELENRLIAAYLPGTPIHIKADIDEAGLRICREAKATGCILSWTVLLGPERKAGDLLCINPLTWTQGGAAASSENPGARLPSGDGYSPVDYEAGPGAACRPDGALAIVKPVSDLVRGLKDPLDRVGIGDYGLFFQNIARNVGQRLRAYEETHP